MQNPTKQSLPDTNLDITDTRHQWLLVWIAFGAVVLLIARSSWLGDDVYITFRAIENMLDGYGPNFNINERVQVYTDPLWFYIQSVVAILSHREYLLTMQILAIAVSGYTLYFLLSRITLTPASGILALACLVSSKAFMDFSTSGLENPLNYLLAVVFCHLALNRPATFRQWKWLVLVATLAVLTRQDMALIFFPLLAYRLWMHIKRKETTLLRAIGAGLLYSLPLWLWIAFSISYYGYPFPNTYYAKLYTGISSSSMIFQGLLYYLSTLEMDTLSLAVIAAGLATAILSRIEDRLMLAVGIVIYLIYIIKIGGDFMGARFLSIPLVIAVVLLTRYDMARQYKLALAAGAILLGLSVSRPTLNYGNDEPMSMKEAVDLRGIADERGYYFHSTSLRYAVARGNRVPKHEWRDSALNAVAAGRKYAMKVAIGFYGVTVGPSFHVLDRAGLADPLLSHLPIIKEQDMRHLWRVGHYIRNLPDGYKQSVLQDKNLITDPNIRPVYDAIRIITRGPLWTQERWREIWRMNTGYYDKQIQQWDRGLYKGPDNFYN